MTTMTAVEVGDKVRATTPKGHEVVGVVEAIKGGWTTITTDEAETVKVRNGSVNLKATEPVVDDEMDEARAEDEEQLTEDEVDDNGDTPADEEDDPMIVSAVVYGTDDPVIDRVYMEEADIRPIQHTGGNPERGHIWIVHINDERRNESELELGDSVKLRIVDVSEKLAGADMEPEDAQSGIDAEIRESEGEDSTPEEKPMGAEGKVKAGVMHYDKSRYVRYKTADGRKGVDSGDDVARALRGKDLEQVYGVVAAALGVDKDELKAKYSHLNTGMQRMNLGNRLRKAIRKETVDESGIGPIANATRLMADHEG